MNPYYLRTLIITLLILFTWAVMGKAQMKMKVTSDKAPIYATPDPNSPFTIITRKGEVFEAKYYTEGWVVIQLFSGAEWYIESTDVRYTGYDLSYSIMESQKTNFCKELNNAREIAIAEASSKYPEEMDQQRSYEKFLVDKFMLSVFRKYNIPATQYGDEIECVVEWYNDLNYLIQVGGPSHISKKHLTKIL